MSIIKRIAAVFIGLMLATVIITMMEKLGHSIYPVPEDIDLTKPEDVKRMMANAPTASLAIVVLGYTLGAFLGAMLAQVISNGPKTWAGGITGAILLFFVIMNLFAMPHPLWMITLSILGVILGAFLGSYLIRKKRTASA
jgi:uncharacterized membrane protein YfcA